MANRRKFLAGIGALATGSAAAVGTGAFTSVTADRSVNVEVAGDSSALLALQDGGGPNSNDYVDTSGNTVSFDFTGTDNSGSGLNTDATTVINDLLTVVNQGTQPVDFHLTFSGNISNGTQYFTFSTDEQGGRTGLNGSGNSISIPAGQSITLDLEVNAPDFTTSGGGTITFHANA
ncbi:hypothetical protein PN416_04585 [Halorubrum ezzemoulense]|uniref:DUF1102 domain-containing protein n=1 Tax=Halorubrum ezzemoulense TaxID=337243 RepID=A0ABT4Z996_HALEZ|nr:hypothetical protein [Halorubrum ezzemoulense]MDB2223859.1 hypothetical protein [Halorubrum ezzemoulense]MDB2294348.1 hypothetical protein [Halorubrum ezzemoulense]MDB9279190.1 hypothetical protein [Halorubrum ezzemoulense]MDB9282712.1 hypothetical protein [Halorubrum ezzemoulense]